MIDAFRVTGDTARQRGHPMTLTPTQQAVLDKMEPGQWYTERELGVRLVTMGVLRRRGLVTCRYGSFISRSTEWQRKDEPQ